MHVPGTRLYAILARAAPLAVVFRRGPSKQVLTLHWDTAKHHFRIGQWFKGRIYERRCDLSPSGDKLIYLAAKQRPPYYSWTAVSRAPFLKAIALWPNMGTWGGGGLFCSERLLGLNHHRGMMKMAPEYSMPKNLRVVPLHARAGGGEDSPILPMRLLRDGWRLTQEGHSEQRKEPSGFWWDFTSNEVWSKTKGSWTIEMRLLAMAKTNAPWYSLEHRITDSDGETAVALGESDWADWSQTGEVLFARAGRLYRIKVLRQKQLAEPEELIDLRELKFEAIEAPPEAARWSGRVPQGRLIPASR